MKLLFNFLIFFFISFLGNKINAENFSAKYKVSTKNITIGELFWDLNINDKIYDLNIELKSRGLLSSLFKFEGSYSVNGFLKNESFFPNSYSQKWLTQKKKKDVQITFEKYKVALLLQQPIEKEPSRVHIDLLRNYCAPLTSFIKLLSGASRSKTIDGRRIYILELIESDKAQNKKSFGIKGYTNIWTDHKRNDLEKISIINKPGSYLPEAIYINFKGGVFRILKD